MIPDLEEGDAVRPVRRWLAVVTAVLAVAGVLAAAVVGGGEQRTGASLTVGEPVPIGALAAASEETAALSYRLEGKATVAVPAFGTREMRVTFDHDAASGRSAGAMVDQGHTTRVVIDRRGGAVYLQLPAVRRALGAGSKPWVRMEVPEGELDAQLAQIDELTGTGALDRLVREGDATATYAGRGRVRGVDVDRYAVRGTRDGGVTTGEVAVDRDGRLRRVHLSVAVGGAGDTVSTDLELFDLGSDDVRVELPPEADVRDADSPFGGAPLD